MLVAAAELLAEYAPAAKNTASKVVKTLKKMKIERPGPELAVHLENYTLGCEYWKSLPVAARTMSAGRCETAMLTIEQHAAAVQAADAKLQEHIQVLMTGREAQSKKARQLGAAYAKEKAKVLSGFQSSPSVLTAWLVRSGTLDVTVEGREAVEKAADTMLKAAGADLSIPFAKPTMLPGGGKDAVTAQLNDLLPAVQEPLAIAMMHDKARLSQSAMVATQLNDKCDALLDTANWVPAAWQAHGWAPNSVTGWCSPWLLSQRAGTTRMTSMDMPTNGMPTLYEVVEGQGWFFCWHADDAEMQGTNITKQYQHLLKNAHPTDSVKWMASSVAIATVNKEDKIWVPFGYFAAVMSAGGVPLLLVGMPWINSKVCAQNQDAAVLVLQNQQRILGNCAQGQGVDGAWGADEGLSEFLNWCKRELKQYMPSLESPSKLSALKDQEEDSADADALAPAAAAGQSVRAADSAASNMQTEPSPTLGALMDLDRAREDSPAVAVTTQPPAAADGSEATVPGAVFQGTVETATALEATAPQTGEAE